MPKILVVDDQAYIRRLVSDVLVADGYEVQAVGDACSVEGDLTSFRPDLVLLDLYLDGPEGFDLLKAIKCGCPKLPVVIMTAYDSYRDDPRLSQADGYVIKRLKFWEEVLATIEEILTKGAYTRTSADTDVNSSSHLGPRIATGPASRC
ncbi:MAG: response regulator [Deltaproteobacteria bacterium]